MNQYQSIDSEPTASGDWLSSSQASALLHVKRSTLYAYVSRGLLTARALPGSRQRVYLRSDLHRLRARSEARSGHRAVAAGALRWGEPVLDSSITEIRPDGHRYRGHSAVELASGGATFEQVAELLWGDAEALGRDAIFEAGEAKLPVRKLHALVVPDAPPLDAMQLALPALAARDDQRLLPARAPTAAVGRRLIRLLVGAAGLSRGQDTARRALQPKRIASAFLRAVEVEKRPAAMSAINQALVLIADHELNPSSFAARVAASAGADVCASVAAALATLSGPRHGGMPARVMALVRETREPRHAARTIGERLRRGEAIPGFGHPLYAQGDPRTPPMLAAARAAAPAARELDVLEALVDAMDLVGAERPTVDVGLVAIACALRRDAGVATALFAVGRMAGWIAHVIEQREADFVLRPRARYVGAVGGAFGAAVDDDEA
jgi:citrate synthase